MFTAGKVGCSVVTASSVVRFTRTKGIYQSEQVPGTKGKGR